jgi:hypothetical protein
MNAVSHESRDGLDMHADLPGEQWTPSNSDVGHTFINDWCGQCARDKVANGTVHQDAAQPEDLCQILGASFRGEAPEWRRVHGEVKCLKFVDARDRIPVERCPHTMELPL